MAFTGSPTFQQISGNIIRCTGLSLGAGASGTIGLATRDTPGDFSLPSAFHPIPYSHLGLTATIEVDVHPNLTGGITVAVPVNTAKAGDTPQDWLATFTNPSGGATQGLEIYFKYHD